MRARRPPRGTRRRCRRLIGPDAAARRAAAPRWQAAAAQGIGAVARVRRRRTSSSRGRLRAAARWPRARQGCPRSSATGASSAASSRRRELGLRRCRRRPVRRRRARLAHRRTARAVRRRPDTAGTRTSTAEQVARPRRRLHPSRACRPASTASATRRSSTVARRVRAAAETVGVDGDASAAGTGSSTSRWLDAATIATLAELGIVASVQPVFDALWGGPDGMYAAAARASAAPAMNPFALDAPRRRRAGVRLGLAGDAARPVGQPCARRRTTTTRPSGSPCGRRSPRTPAAAGGPRAATTSGVLAPGAPATFAVWDAPGDLAVQTPDARVAAWSTDPRAGVPVLPDPTTTRCRPARRARRVTADAPSSRATARQKLDLDPATVRKARGAGPAGRPARRRPGPAAHHGVGRAGDAAAGRAAPAPTPTASRGSTGCVDAVRADVGLEHGVALPVWDALVRGEADDLAVLAQKAAAGSVHVPAARGPRRRSAPAPASRKAVGAGHQAGSTRAGASGTG